MHRLKASAMASCCTHPLDLLKVRMQTAQQKASLVQTCVHIVRQESVVALFNGLSASLLRQLTYSTVRFGGFEELKRRWTQGGREFSMEKAVIAGVLAGGVAGIAGNPADVVNVRMQNDGKLPMEQRRNYRNAVDGLLRIVREEGPMTLFRGLSANVNRSMIMTASQLGSYDQCKQLLLKTRFFRDDIGTHFTASLLAGLVATTVSSPVDVVKTRMMSATSALAAVSTGNGGKEAVVYKGTLDALVKILRNEGLGALFKGWLPSYSRLGPQTVLTFIFMEKMKELYRRKYSGDRRA